MELPVKYDSLEWPERRAVREEYIRLQKGNCAHCGEPLSGPCSDEMDRKPIKRRLFPETFFKYPVHLHHSHVTGMTIGAIHAQCNAVLWQYRGE